MKPERTLRIKVRSPYAPFWPHPDAFYGYLHNIFPGEIHDVPEAIASVWVREGWAEPVEAAP